jgi:hypothetical protein
MKIKKEDPSKVIVIPRPPRQANQELRHLNPVDAPSEEEDVEQPDPNKPAVEAIDPGCGPMNNQVEGPAQGLAGAPAAEALAEEPAEEE